MAHTDTSVTVNRRIDHSAAEVFDVLTLPRNHVQIDGSGFVKGVDPSGADRITAVGQTFRMNMSGPHMGGDYQTDNHVTGYAKDKLVAWKTAPADTEPPGWEWTWELAPAGPNATDVTITYDWSKVTDKDLLAKVGFPLVTEKQLDGSLERLEEATSGS